ncbi:hypothetical protein GC176_12660 [bacterium]|nr:hypothetical protein [bacterium]
MARWQSGGMALNLPDHRDDKAVRSLLSEFSAATDLGQQLRQALAKRTLRDMAAAEADLTREQEQAAAIEERLSRMEAEHSLRMQYLIHFGVTPEERHEFQQLLEESAQHGGLSPREAATLAHARHSLKEPQRNGSVADSETESVASPSTTV